MKGAYARLQGCKIARFCLLRLTAALLRLNFKGGLKGKKSAQKGSQVKERAHKREPSKRKSVENESPDKKERAQTKRKSPAIG
jgi:hypothetical protein